MSVESNPDSAEVNCTEVNNTNVFNMRLVNLRRYCDESEPSARVTALRATLRREKLPVCRMDCTHNASKALDLVRQLVQDNINRDLRAVLDVYTQRFFQPALDNIRENKEDVTDEHLNVVLMRVLNEAKQMYRTEVDTSREFTSPEIPSFAIHKTTHIESTSRLLGDSDAESDISQASSAASKSRKRAARFLSPQRYTPTNTTTTLTLEHVENWNPNRITSETRFVLGSWANRALGMVQRGRIYIKYPHIFRYTCDNDDKSWLNDCTRTNRTAGRAYILIMDDVVQIAETSRSSNVNCTRQLFDNSFVLPEQLRQKVINYARVEHQKMRQKFGPTDSATFQSDLLM